MSDSTAGAEAPAGAEPPAGTEPPAVVAKVEEAGPCRKRLTVTVPAERVREEVDLGFRELIRSVQVPGFRVGHVPPSIIKQRFSEEIKTDVVEALVPRYFNQETERLGMHPVHDARDLVAERV